MKMAFEVVVKEVMLKQQVAALERKLASLDKWIKVKDQLPPEGEDNRVLLYLGKLKYPYEPYIVWGYREGKRWQTQWGEFDGDKTPTHWQPLPNPPSPASKEGQK
jgi:Protein of unknown function (DUF551)